MLLAFLTMQGCASHTKWEVDAVEPSRKGVAPSSIQVSKFSSKNRQHGASFAQMLEGNIQAQNFVEVKKQGALSRITGSMEWGEFKRETWKEDYEYKNKTYYTYYATLKTSLTVSYTLSIGDKNYSATYTKDYSDKEKSGDSYSEAKSKLRSDDAIRARLMRQAASEIVKDITPYKVKKTYKLKLGGSDKLELGAEYLKINRQDQAMEIFRQIADKTKDNEERAAAIYNQGVVYESRGEFDEAFTAYRDASQLHLEELMYPEAFSRLEQEVKKYKQLEKQLESLK